MLASEETTGRRLSEKCALPGAPETRHKHEGGEETKCELGQKDGGPDGGPEDDSTNHINVEQRCWAYSYIVTYGDAASQHR